MEASQSAKNLFAKTQSKQFKATSPVEFVKVYSEPQIDEVNKEEFA